MALISLTRLRLASPWYLPGFAWHAMRSIAQARRAPGFVKVRLLADRRLTFWTVTAWTDLDAMKRFRSAGAHRTVMPRLATWCDEASVTRWVGDPAAMDDWAAAHARMVADGEPSFVRHPSPAHLARTYPPPAPLARRLKSRIFKAPP